MTSAVAATTQTTHEAAPRRAHGVKKVLILGSSALKIGEAGEFDYSGSQCIKALREEGVASVVINPNIATIQTSDYLADEVYFLPVNPYFVEKVIEKERPDGILLGFGGQTALNCGLALFRSGVLAKYNVRVLGTSVKAIEDTEDRDLFAKRLAEIGVLCPRSEAAETVEHALQIADRLKYPVMLRIAYALGGLGSGKCLDKEALRERATKALSYTNQILVEEYLEGWKEVEYEVVRDVHDNCITVCNMENFDPLGIHTGESIVVAPSQTLTDTEYHMLREIAIKTIRHLGIVGECNIQYALDPNSREYRVIEVNARLSRSSALASKATGYPIARVSAKIAIGKTLDEIPNPVTGTTMACFEPALDYIVVKLPRWPFDKFTTGDRTLFTQMKATGEVMAIDRSFEAGLLKAIRGLEVRQKDLRHQKFAEMDDAGLREAIRVPTDERLWAIAEGLRRGWSAPDVRALCKVDLWFLTKMQGILAIERGLTEQANEETVLAALEIGYSPLQIVALCEDADLVDRVIASSPRQAVFKMVDTCAGEFESQTPYFYAARDLTDDSALLKN